MAGETPDTGAGLRFKPGRQNLEQAELTLIITALDLLKGARRPEFNATQEVDKLCRALKGYSQAVADYAVATAKLPPAMLGLGKKPEERPCVNP